jgi:uncharacterized protein YdbL (DUF1318 family)
MIRRVVAVLAAFLLGGCVAVTVNVNFPQETIDSAASSIEDQVRTPSPAAPAPKSGGSRSALHGLHLAHVVLGVGVAHAEEVSVETGKKIRTRTPEVQALVDARRARYADLSSLMAKGCVGERADGTVERRPGAGCPSDLGALLAAENRDRAELFRTIVEQNHMPAGDLARVQAGFARRNRERAPAGTWVQDDVGRWRRK